MFLTQEFCCLDSWTDATLRMYLLTLVDCSFIEGSGGGRFMGFGVIRLIVSDPNRRVIPKVAILSVGV